MHEQIAAGDKMQYLFYSISFASMFFPVLKSKRLSKSNNAAAGNY